MNFGLTEEQLILKKTARDFLEKECPRSMVREMATDETGYSPQLWQKMAELGWLGLAFPSRYGGGDGSFLDLVVLTEELGRALVPCPFFATIVLSGLYLLEAGTETQKEEFLPKIAGGDIIFTLALNEPGSDYYAGSIATTAATSQEEYTVNGTKLFVPYARVADYLLCVTRTGKTSEPEGGITTFVMNTDKPGITCNPLNTIGRDHQYEVIFKNVVASRGDILGELDNAWKDVKITLQKATVLLCAEMNAAAREVLDMTVNYAKERVQFGRPIGSLTAIQHHCANMTVSLEASYALAYEAAWKISQDLPCAKEASMAKSCASECYTKVTQMGVMIHGGVGITEEHDMPLYYRHAKASEIILGDSDSHREKIAKEILD
jgi:alkylation response protein AidB-like acyl-CoA dehydrogenase